MDFKALLKAGGVFVVVVIALWFARGLFKFISKWIVSPGLVVLALIAAFFAYKFFRDQDNSNKNINANSSANTNTNYNSNTNTNSSNIDSQDDFN